MKPARWLIVVLACVLIGAGVWAKQAGQIREGENIPFGKPFGPVITGAEIGFQQIAAESGRDGKVTGRWMVKINGQWMETKAPMVFR